jgi:hypothetical protein
MNILPVSPASQASPQLLIRIGNVISLYPNDPVVFDMQFQGTSSTTVKCGCRPDYFHISHVILPKL